MAVDGRATGRVCRRRERRVRAVAESPRAPPTGKRTRTEVVTGAGGRTGRSSPRRWGRMRDSAHRTNGLAVIRLLPDGQRDSARRTDRVGSSSWNEGTDPRPSWASSRGGWVHLGIARGPGRNHVAVPRARTRCRRSPAPGGPAGSQAPNPGPGKGEQANLTTTKWSNDTRASLAPYSTIVGPTVREQPAGGQRPVRAETVCDDLHLETHPTLPRWRISKRSN
jgi:hypothetical protein